jgi:hypothetical protein
MPPMELPERLTESEGIMNVAVRWIWIAAIVWVVLDVLTVAVGWGQIRQTGTGIIRVLMFAISLHAIAYINQKAE